MDRFNIRLDTAKDRNNSIYCKTGKENLQKKKKKRIGNQKGMNYTRGK